MMVILSYFVQSAVKNDRSVAAGLRNENIRVTRLFCKEQTAMMKREREREGKRGREINEIQDFNLTAHFNFLIYNPS